MRRMTRTLLVGLLVVALAPVTAAPAAAENQVDRPYKGRTAATVAEDGPCLDIFAGCDFTTSGTGNFAHMGQVVETGEFTGMLTFEVCPLLNGNEGLLFTISAGTFTTVAADGSTVSGTFDTPVCIGDGPSAVIGSRTITGGTGRFAGATGEATASGVSTPISTELSFDGRIEY